jgi:hypothetical protein
VDEAGFKAACADVLPAYITRFDKLVGGEDTAKTLWTEAQKRMSQIGGPIRDMEQMDDGVRQARERLENFDDEVRTTTIRGLGDAFHYRDALICQITYLGAMADYIRAGGKSRGSAMYRDEKGMRAADTLPELFTYQLDGGELNNVVQLASYSPEGCSYSWRNVRPIPQEDDFFENVWRSYREDGNVH